MTQTEFLSNLQRYLSGYISQDSLSENITFYEHYFQEQIALGKKEEMICHALGDPRLIARSIIEQEKRINGSSSGIPGHSTFSESTSSQEEPNGNSQNTQSSSAHTHVFWVPRVLSIIITLAIIILIIVLAVTLFSALLPFILVGILFWIVISFIRGISK